MKKFAWRLQRLLDIKIKQEDSIRAQLVTVTEQTVAIRGQIMLQKATLRQRLNELSLQRPAERIESQKLFLTYSQVTEDKIRALGQELEVLEEKRKAKIQEILEVRKFRKSLEKLREKAKQEYMLASEKFEQNELDDRNSIKYARQIIKHDIANAV